MIETIEAAEKRLLIAKDVLELLEEEAIVPQSGRYIVMPKPAGARASSDAKKVLEGFISTGGKCEVCAKGAMVVAHCLRFNSCTVEQAKLNRSRVDASGRLMANYADDSFLREIEWAFEREWKRDYPDSRKRLIAICENIIRNKGEFKIYEVAAP